MANMSDTLPNETWLARQIRAFFQSLWEKEIAIRVVALAGSAATLMVMLALVFFKQKMFFFGVASPFFFLTWLSLLFFFSRDILDIWMQRHAACCQRTLLQSFTLFFDLLTRVLIILSTTIVGVSLIYFLFVDRPLTASLGVRVSLWPVERHVSVSVPPEVAVPQNAGDQAAPSQE